MAVVGAGAFGRNHLRVYRELETAGEGVLLVAAVEPDQARAADASAKYAIPVFGTIEELLSADLHVGAASVAVPTEQPLARATLPSATNVVDTVLMIFLICILISS